MKILNMIIPILMHYQHFPFKKTVKMYFVALIRPAATACQLHIIQLLTNEALDMMWYRPDNTNIDRGEAEVNIGILWSISHHIQCLISQ